LIQIQQMQRSTIVGNQRKGGYIAVDNRKAVGQCNTHTEDESHSFLITYYLAYSGTLPKQKKVVRPHNNQRLQELFWGGGRKA
jgi:hypothetical protein